MYRHVFYQITRSFYTGFDEALHFDKFRKHNIIFNAESRESYCDDHVGLLEMRGYNEAMADEYLVFMLRQLVNAHGQDVKGTGQVQAVKAGTRKEIYKRLCIARDVLHSSPGENISGRILWLCYTL